MLGLLESEAFRSWPMLLDFTAIPEFDVPILPSRSRVHGLDTVLLKSIVSSNSWDTMRSTILAVLKDSGYRGLERVLLKSGKKLGKDTAAGLASRIRKGLPQTLRKKMQYELKELTNQFPQLRDGTLRNGTIAALSLLSIEALAASKTRFPLDSVKNIPWLDIFAPHPPSFSVTALELPYRLILSPLDSDPGHWSHTDMPVQHNGRTELWHTRLRSTKGNFGPDGEAKVRAIWSPDYPISTQVLTEIAKDSKPFRMSLDPLDREMLVRLMAGYDEAHYSPIASRSKRLHLTALGGLLDVEGGWERRRPDNVDIQQWQHILGLGRDQYVRVVYAGYLCPFGHAASLIRVTERKFASLPSDRTTDPTKQRIAVLRQRYFILVREHVKQYESSLTSEHDPFGGRTFPFSRVEILTRVTPNLQPPESDPCRLKQHTALGVKAVTELQGIEDRMLFWPMISSSQDFEFDIVATDFLEIAFRFTFLFFS